MAPGGLRRGPRSRATGLVRKGPSPCWTPWPASGPGAWRAATRCAIHARMCRAPPNGDTARSKPASGSPATIACRTPAGTGPSPARAKLALRAAALSPLQRRQAFWADRPWMAGPSLRILSRLGKVASRPHSWEAPPGISNCPSQERDRWRGALEAKLEDGEVGGVEILDALAATIDPGTVPIPELHVGVRFLGG